MCMKKGAAEETLEGIKVIYVLLVVLVLITVFYLDVVPRVLYSTCWRGQTTAARNLFPRMVLAGIPIEQAGLPLKNCLAFAVIGNNTIDENGMNLCQRTCDYLINVPVAEGEKPLDGETCLKACTNSQCKGHGLMMVVPKRLGFPAQLTNLNKEQSVTDLVKSSLLDDIYCISTGKDFIPAGGDPSLKAILLTAPGGLADKVACLKFTREKEGISVQLDHYADTYTSSLEPAELAREACGWT